MFDLVAAGIASSTANSVANLINAGLDISTVLMIFSGVFTAGASITAILKKYAGKAFIKKFVAA
ncbi:MAG: hypothetical protein ACFWTQ_07620 [Lactococcus sp.]|jgi:hypothetical protein